jgi:hypothetical protein
LKRQKMKNLSKKNDTKPEILAIAAVFVLLSAYVIGLTIRNIETTKYYNQTRPTLIAKQSHPRSITNYQPQITEPQYLQDSFIPAENPNYQWNNNDWTAQQPQEIQQPALNQNNQPAPQLNIVSDNITPDRISQLQQAAQNVMQSFQNLSPDQQTTLMQRAQEMQQTLLNMDPQQRQQIMNQVQQQVQQFMQNGQLVIPDNPF